MIRSRIIQLVALTIAAALAAPSFAPVPLTARSGDTPTPAPTASRYGVNDDYIWATSQPAMTRMREAGFGWVHYVFYWYQTNPLDPDAVGDEAAYDWTEPDRELNYIAEAGLNVYARIVFPPAWATGVSYPNHKVPFYCYDSTQPYDLKDDPDCRDPARIPSAEDVERYVRAVIARYGDRIRFWGFGFESHSRVFWQGTQAQFAERVLATGYRVAKEIDPGLTIVGPDDDLVDSLDTVLGYEAQYGRFCDVISFHLLRHAIPGGIDQVAAALQDLLARRGQGRAFWITEFGTQAPADDSPTAGVQAWWLGDQLARMREMPWIDKVFLYRVKHATFLDFGLLRDDDSPGLSYESVRSFLATVSTPRFSYLAEGATLGFFDLDICLANPNGVTAPVKLTFLRRDGTVLVDTRVLAPHARETIRVNTIAGLGSAEFSTVVESTAGVPVLAERTMRWDRSAGYGGHTATPVDGAATRWYFAEGSQGFFDTYVLLANSGIEPARVTVTFLRENGAPVEVIKPVASMSRESVCAGDVAGMTNTNFSILVESDKPVFAERAMYFGTRRFWDGGHGSAGVPAPAPEWFHAEGATGPYFDTYICVGNPNAQPAEVTLTFLLTSGQTVTLTETIGEMRRRTFEAETIDPRLAHAEFSTTVAADMPIISERAMYWPGPFTTWAEAHNSFGVTETAEAWGLAEGRVGGPGNHTTFILIANPNPTSTTAYITFLREDGSTIERPFAIGASSRRTICVNGEVPGLAHEAFGAVVETRDQSRIAVERAMYWDVGGEIWAGGTNAVGIKLR